MGQFISLNFRVGLFILSVFCFCVLTAPDSSAAHKCSHCFKQIDGQWLEVDGDYFHPNHFICSNCLKPIADQRFFIHNERYYDSVCLVNFVAERCEYCRRPVISESIYFDSKFYHATCYNEFVGKRCVVCGQAAQGEFFVDNRGNAVCQNHKNDALKCNACQKFLSPVFNGSWDQLADGRHICSQCGVTAVNKIDNVRKLAAEVQEYLRAAGVNIDQKFKLAFVSLQELNSKSENFQTDQLGATLYKKSEMLGGLISSEKYEIRVLYGLPRSQLRAVLAHELMHVWQFAHAPRPQNQQMCEGTCQYAAYLVLQNDRTEDGRFFLDLLINQDDEIYGQGFKKVLSYINSIGLNPWLDYLKHNKEAPW